MSVSLPRSIPFRGSAAVARHGAERYSYMKVLFGISFLLESLGLDVGMTRLLVTFMLQWVIVVYRAALTHVGSQIRANPNQKQTSSAYD
jgi:hypothetical protein